PACRLLPPSQELGSPYGESPLLPGWRPPDWQPTAVPAWQASWSTDAGLNFSRPGASKEDVDQPEFYEEEIDRFLRSLDVGSSTQSSGIAGATVSDALPLGPCLESRRSESPPLLCRSDRLSPADALQQLPEEAFVPDSPPRLRCGRCGRRFAAPRLEVHEAICFATVPVQRGVFESRRQRLEGFALPKPAPEVVARSRKNLPETTTVAQPRPKAKSLPRKNSQPTTRSRRGQQKETQELCTPQRRPRPRGISSTPVLRPRRTSRSSAGNLATEEVQPKASTPPRKSCDAAVAEAAVPWIEDEPAQPSPEPISASPSSEPSAVQSSTFWTEDSHLHSLRWERITRALCFSEELKRLEQLDSSAESSSSAVEELEVLAEDPAYESQPAEVAQDLSMEDGLEDSSPPSRRSPSLCWEHLARGLDFAEEAAEGPIKDPPEMNMVLPAFPVVEPREEELANSLFSTWVQRSSSCRVPPLVKEAAELCAEVDALLGDDSIGVAESPEAAAQVPASSERPRYDPRKYYESEPAQDLSAPYEEEPESTQLADWLKRCADKVRQRQELRQGRTPEHSPV
ncbi:unnamed protein product, partial [Symbiodinium sp. CCMP2456]